MVSDLNLTVTVIWIAHFSSTHELIRQQVFSSCFHQTRQTLAVFRAFDRSAGSSLSCLRAGSADQPRVESAVR